jgi:hypothetical protein
MSASDSASTRAVRHDPGDPILDEPPWTWFVDDPPPGPFDTLVGAQLAFTLIKYLKDADSDAVLNDENVINVLLAQATATADPRQYLLDTIPAIAAVVAVISGTKLEQQRAAWRRQQRKTRADNLGKHFPGIARAIRLLEDNGHIDNDATDDEILLSVTTQWPDWKASPQTVHQALRRRARRLAR